MLRTIVLPPGSPAAAVERAAERRSSASTATKSSRGKRIKALQFVPQYVTNANLNAQVRSNLTVKPEIRSFVADYIKQR